MFEKGDLDLMAYTTHPLRDRQAEARGESSEGMRLLLALLGALLLQTVIVAEVNTSGADLVMLLILLVLLAQNRSIPVFPTLALVLVLVITMATATFGTPTLFGVQVTPVLLARDASKLVIAYLYFVVGHALLPIGGMAIVIRWYSRIALVIAGVGMVWTLLNIGIFRDLLFLWDIRFRGMVADPNLCAILLVAALPYYIRGQSRTILLRTGAIVTVLGGVLATGSKTGLAVFAFYMILTGIRAVVEAWRTGRIVSAALIPIAALTLLLLGGSRVIGTLSQAADGTSGASRAVTVLVNPSAALNEAGSGRGEAFSTAISIITTSPVAGVGIGTYSDVAEAISGSPVIAHNTYLQLASEWGIPLSVGFVALTLLLIFLAAAPSSDRPAEASVLGDICLILLAGGAAISLNNVRMFWLCLGGLYASKVTKRQATSKNPGVAPTTSRPGGAHVMAPLSTRTPP